MDEIFKALVIGNEKVEISFPFSKIEFGTHWQFCE